MRLLNFLKQIVEDGDGGAEGGVGIGAGGVTTGSTTSGNIAKFYPRLPFNTRRVPFLKKKKKKKEGEDHIPA